MNPNPTAPPGAGPLRPRSPNDPNFYVASLTYVYEADTLPNYPAGIGPTAQAVLTFNIANDSDFFWGLLGCYAAVASDGVLTSTQPVPGLNILLVNTTTGRQYMNNPVPLANLSGDGKLPFVLPSQTLWEKQSTIQITLTNTTDDTTYSNIQLSFIGIKAFTRPGVR
jgi:hypothetical protein